LNEGNFGSHFFVGLEESVAQPESAAENPADEIETRMVTIRAEYVIDDTVEFDSGSVIDAVVELVDEMIDEDQFAEVVDQDSGVFAVGIELIFCRSEEYSGDESEPGFYDLEVETSTVTISFAESAED